MTRDEMVDALVEWDIMTIREAMYDNDAEFLDAVLRGEGWIPYNQLTDQQVLEEYQDRCAEYPDEMGLTG